MGDYFDDAFAGVSGDSPAEFGDDWREWELGLRQHHR
jgi:hypothetical protein